MWASNDAMSVVKNQIIPFIQVVATALLVLFFFIGLFKALSSLAELKRPEVVGRHLVRFVIVKLFIDHGQEVLERIYEIFTLMISKLSSIGSGALDALGTGYERIFIPFGGTIPPGAVTDLSVDSDPGGLYYLVPRSNVFFDTKTLSAINSLNWWEDIWMSIIALVAFLVIFALTLIMMWSVGSRFITILLHWSFFPLAISTFAGEQTSNVGRSYIKSYVGVCAQGLAMALSLWLFAIFYKSHASVLNIVSFPGVLNDDGTVASNFGFVAQQILSLVFNALVLTGMVKGSDRIVKEMMSL